jgi:hypothetical protein
MPDGSLATSGTEYEIAWALDHADKNRGVPGLQVYHNRSKPTPPLEPKEEREAFGRQWDAVQEFFGVKHNERSFAGKKTDYRDLEQFEVLFREHFRDFLARRIDQEVGQKVLNRKVRRCAHKFHATAGKVHPKVPLLHRAYRSRPKEPTASADG